MISPFLKRSRSATFHNLTLLSALSIPGFHQISTHALFCAHLAPSECASQYMSNCRDLLSIGVIEWCGVVDRIEE